MNVKNGKGTLFYRLVTGLAIIVLGVVAYTSLHKINSVTNHVNRIDTCAAAPNSLGCHIEECIRASSRDIALKQCRPVLIQAHKLHLLPPESKTIPPPTTGSGPQPQSGSPPTSKPTPAPTPQGGGAPGGQGQNPSGGPGGPDTGTNSQPPNDCLLHPLLPVCVKVSVTP